MDFNLNEEQEMLRRSAREFLTAECPKTLVREMMEDEKGYSLNLWHKMAKLGWMGLAFPEDYGGTGGNFLDLCVLLEEMGRACLPGPFFSTVFGGLLILSMGSNNQKKGLLPKITSGGAIVALAPVRPSSKYGVEQGVQIEPAADGDGYIVSGTKLFVPDAHVADLVMFAADIGESIMLFFVNGKTPGVSCTLLRTIGGDKQCQVDFDKVKVPRHNLLGYSVWERDKIEARLAEATVGKCAEMVGGAQQVLEMTVEYAKQRMQFGRHIGSFQIIQHYCVNILVDVDACRFITYDAAWKISAGLPYMKAASIAKAWVNEAYQRVVMRSHQIHGAIAFSNDYDLGLYTKRSKAGELMLGDSDFHREIVAQKIGL